MDKEDYGVDGYCFYSVDLLVMFSVLIKYGLKDNDREDNDDDLRLHLNIVEIVPIQIKFHVYPSKNISCITSQARALAVYTHNTIFTNSIIVSY